MAPATINSQGAIVEKPTSFQLGSPFPYPFYAVATIPFILPDRGHVRFELFDAGGNRVHTFLDEVLDAGNHRCMLDRDALKLTSTSYICVIHWSDGKEAQNAFQLISLP